MQEHHHHWYSHNLGKNMEMLSFGTRGAPVILFPTSMGRYYENKDFHLIDSVRWFIEEGIVKIYCPDGIDSFSWYNKNIHPAERVHNHILYDKYLLEELVPLCQNETGHSRVTTAGCSFGGYHATNFGFRHPEVIRYIFNMSAAFDIKPQLDGFYNDEVYFNNPLDFIPNAQNDNFSELFVILGSGEYDICLSANKQMHQILNKKGIHSWLDIRKGAKHDWPVWREMFPQYISFLKEFYKP